MEMLSKLKEKKADIIIPQSQKDKLKAEAEQNGSSRLEDSSKWNDIWHPRTLRLIDKHDNWGS